MSTHSMDIEERQIKTNPRIGLYYLLGSLCLIASIFILHPWGWIALWPALSLAIVAAAYFGLGVRIYGKRSGRLPWSRRILLAPVLAGQWLSWRHYAKKSRPWDEVAPGILLGRVLTQTEAQSAIENGVTAILDVTGEFSAPQAFRKLASTNPQRHAHSSDARANDATHPIAQQDPPYLNLPILDLTPPTTAQISKAIAFINNQLAQSGTIYIHCKAGYSRSAAIVGAWLISTNRAASANDAINLLKQQRPGIILRPEAIEAIQQWRNTQESPNKTLRA